MFGGSPKEKLQGAIDKGDLMQLKMAIVSAEKGGVEAALIKVREGLLFCQLSRAHAGSTHFPPVTAYPIH